MTAADILITNARVLTMDPARPAGRSDGNGGKPHHPGWIEG